MTRWLITGATGLLGSNAVLQLSGRHHVVGAARNRPVQVSIPFIEADLGNAADRTGLVERANAEVVLHGAAVASIEACEASPGLAHEVNVVASAELAAQAARAGADFVYISTDAVFDGASGDYCEDDAASPISEYGRSKLAGERAVLEANPDAIVARVNFFGWSPTGTRSLAEFFHSRLARGEETAGFEDIIVSTLYVDHLIAAVEEMVARGAKGVFHVASSEPTSKYEFGRRLASTFGFDPDLVIPALSTDHLADRRGSRLSLNTSRIEALLGRTMPDQEAGLAGLLASARAGRPRDISAFAMEREV